MSVLLFASEDEKLEHKIARKSAEKLGYQTLNAEFLNEIAQIHALDPIKLKEAMQTTPSIFKRISPKIWHYWLSCVEMEVLNRLIEDNIVCWGLEAHLYVVVVSHVLKVRLIEASEDASKLKSDRAKERLRDKWAMTAFKRRSSDPKLYDMMLNMDQITPDEAVSTISSTMEYARFKPMTYSMNNLKDRALAAKVKNRLLKTLTDIRVHAQNGTVVVNTTSLKRERKKKVATIKEIAGQMDDIGYLEVHWNKDALKEAANSYR